MIEEINFSKKRIVNLLVMFVAMFVVTAFLCITKSTSIDVIISISFLNIIFFALLFVGLEIKRRRGEFSHREISYGKLAFVFSASLIVLFGLSFLPDFTKPIVILSIILYVFSDESIALYISLYMAIILVLVGSCNFYELASLVLISSGIISLTTLIKEKKYRTWISICIIAINIAVPCIFYYLSNQEIKFSIFIYNGITSIFLFLFIMLLYIPLKTYVSKEEEALLDVIVMDNYSLVCDIKAFSKFEYNHAIKVMNISRKCALNVGADEKVCSAAGLYYRLGKMEGEPFVENGVKLAINHCFPEKVINILSEYNGEYKPISSVESAIVNMVNIVVTKIELLDKDAMSSGWNQDIVIYQTLNELSGKGLYDNSGLSMNQFLKVRDILANEENLL